MLKGEGEGERPFSSAVMTLTDSGDLQPGSRRISKHSSSSSSEASVQEQASTALLPPTAPTPFSNRNVRYTIVFNFCDGACFSVWGAQLFPVLVKQVAGDTAVGWLAAVSGIMQLLGAAGAGYVGDRVPRQFVIQIAAACGVAAATLYLAGVVLLWLPALVVAQAVWGVYVGTVSTSTEALFADSVASGQRAYIYNLKWIVQTLCYVVGYVAALAVLWRLGNEWSLTSICRGMVVGLALHPVALALLGKLQDRYALNEGVTDSAATAPTGSEVLVVEVLEERDEESKERVAETEVTSWRRDQPSGSLEANSTYSEGSIPLWHLLAQGSQRQSALHSERQLGRSWVARMYATAVYGVRHCLCSWRAVPYLVCLVDFLMAVGSGMTLQYFPLFFVEDCGVKPVGLYLTYLASTCLTAVTSTVVRYVGEHFTGRLPAVIAARALGITLLLLMGVSHGSAAGHVPYMVIAFIGRNACMNAVMGLTRSVIMDCVAKESRAKWSAFESVSSFTWAGSAMVGEYIVSSHSYQYAFTITALFHFMAIALLIPAAAGAAPLERRLLLEVCHLAP